MTLILSLFEDPFLFHKIQMVPFELYQPYSSLGGIPFITAILYRVTKPREKGVNIHEKLTNLKLHNWTDTSKNCLLAIAHTDRTEAARIVRLSKHVEQEKAS